MTKFLFCSVVLFSLSASATISQVQSKATWGATGATCGVNFNSNPTTGNLIAVWTSWTTSGTNNVTASVRDNLNNGTVCNSAGQCFYASAVGPTLQSASNTAAQIFYAPNIQGHSNDPVTVTFSSAPTSSNCVIVEYGGLDQNYPLDSVSAGYSTSGNPTNLLDSGAVAPANSNLLVFGGGTSDNGTPNTTGLPWAGIQSSGGSITEQLIVSGNSTLQRAPATLGTSTGNWVMQMAVFRDASWTVAGGWPPARLGQILYASQFPGSDASAKIQSAINACPPAGCTVSALDLPDAGGTGSMAIDPGSKQVMLYLGPYNYHISTVTLRPGFYIFGQGPVAGGTSLTSVNTAGSPIVLGSGAPASEVVLSGFILFGPGHTDGTACTNQTPSAVTDGILLDNNVSSNSGLWYSQFQNIIICGFSGIGLHLKGTTGSGGVTQFDTYTNIVVYRAVGGGSALKMEGAMYQQMFINDEFDANCLNRCIDTSSSPGVYLGGVTGGPASGYPYNISFLQTTIQGTKVAVQVDGASNVTFNNMHHEAVNGAYQITYGSSGVAIPSNGIKITNSSFNGNVGVNSGGGYILNVTTSHVNGVTLSDSLYNSSANNPDAWLVGTAGAVNVVLSNNTEVKDGKLIGSPDQGSCTLSSGSCGAQNLSYTRIDAPLCTGSWNGGGGTPTGFFSFPSTTSTVTPADTAHEDSSHLNWVCP
jgi:hypothetical protein